MAVIRIRRGLNANIPLATGLQGELAISTDTRELYVSTANNANFQPMQIQAANVLNNPATSIVAVQRSWLGI
jgi:hypothetical protein